MVCYLLGKVFEIKVYWREFKKLFFSFGGKGFRNSIEFIYRSGLYFVVEGVLILFNYLY